MTHWKILVVDDDADVLRSTGYILEEVVINGKPLEIQGANSAAEAERILEKQRDFAVLIVDISMEKPQSGLTLVNRIRGRYAMEMARIILRTGQPGETLRQTAVDEYEINDYIEKNTSTSWRLKTAVVTAVRAFQQLQNYQKVKTAMDGILGSSQELLATEDPKQFARAAVMSCISALGPIAEVVFGYAGHTTAFGLVNLTILASDDKHQELVEDFGQLGKRDSTMCAVRQTMVDVLASGKSIESEVSKTIFVPIDATCQLVLWIGKEDGFDKAESEIIDYLMHTIKVAFGRLVMMRERMDEVTISMGILAHEFRTPIASLKMATEFMEDSLEQDVVPKVKYAKLLQNSSQILNRMTMHIDQSIENVRIVLSDQLTVPLKKVDISALLRNLLEIHQIAFSGSGTIRQEIEDGIVALVDGTLLEQVVINLISNALKALVARKVREAGAQIEIALSADGEGHAVLKIKDHGTGINPEHVKRIFDPFFTSSSTPAHGLGLTMVRKSIDGMGGAIECHSEPGVGTEFVIRLRMCESQAPIFENKAN